MDIAKLLEFIDLHAIFWHISYNTYFVFPSVIGCNLLILYGGSFLHTHKRKQYEITFSGLWLYFRLTQHHSPKYLIPINPLNQLMFGKVKSKKPDLPITISMSWEADLFRAGLKKGLWEVGNIHNINTLSIQYAK